MNQIANVTTTAVNNLPAPLRRRKPLQFIHLTPPFDRYTGTIPEAVAAVPSMMSMGEREFLYGIAKDYYKGDGLIIDAGTFLGASTVCLGSGLKENQDCQAAVSQWQKPIISFELGIANSQMPVSFKRHQVGQNLKAGDSFAPIVEEHIAPVADVVNMQFGDITKTGKLKLAANLNKGARVEILFLDVLKSPELNSFCFQEYFPRLIPRRSLVIQQDYLNGDLPFIHINQEYFADKFEYVGEISSSAVFRLVHRITEQEVEELFENPPEGEERVSLVSKAAKRSIDHHRRLIIAFSKLRILMQVRGLDAAKAYWSLIEEEYAEEIAQEQYRRVQNVIRAARYLCETGPGEKNEREAVKISTGHRGMDHRRTDM